MHLDLDGEITKVMNKGILFTEDCAFKSCSFRS